MPACLGMPLVARRLTVRLSDEDEEMMKVVAKRYGQNNADGVMRLCLHLVAQAEQIILKSSVVPAEGERQAPPELPYLRP